MVRAMIDRLALCRFHISGKGFQSDVVRVRGAVYRFRVTMQIREDWLHFRGLIVRNRVARSADLSSRMIGPSQRHAA